MIYLSIKFHLPTSNGSLIITIQLKAKYKFQVAEMLFYILKQKSLTKVDQFSKIC